MKIFTTLCCAAVAICSAIYAQSPVDHITVHFNTPVFVGETKIPAGDCDIQLMHGNSDNVIAVLRSQGGQTAAAMVSRMSVSDVEGDTSVVLNRRGKDFQVYRIVLSDHSGYQFNNAE